MNNGASVDPDRIRVELKVRKLPEGHYCVRVIDFAILFAGDQSMGAVWILRIVRPSKKRYLNEYLVKLTPLLDSSDFVKLARELTICGISDKDQYGGDVSGLLKVRELEIGLLYLSDKEDIRVIKRVA
jgi:hypothetical protein